MPITQVGTGSGANSSYGTGFTVTSPGTLVSSDYVLIVIRTEVAASPGFSASGFSVLFADVDSTNQNCGITVLGGSGFTGSGGFAVTASGLASGDWCARTCTAWAGTDGNPIVGAAFSDSPGGADFTIPAITTTVPNAVVLAVGGQTFVAAPRTFTPTFDAEEGNDACFQASRSFASAGSTGTVSVANTGYSSAISLLVGLQEPAPAATQVFRNLPTWRRSLGLR